MATPNYAVDYEDERFAQVESDKQEAMSDLEQTYSGMIGESDKYYQQQIDASKEWADKQSQLQQEQTDFTIEKIEQQKDQAHKDYTKEQSGAYVDWRKQSNEYGSEAEKMASAGLQNTGFSESSQVSMYNTYQNRAMAAREAYTQIVLNFDNAIKEAKLQNNSILAEIAFNSQQEQLKLALEGFQHKNQLILDQANKKIELDNNYYQRYLAVLDQINTENALAEDVRQFEQNYALQMKQFDEQIRQFNQEYSFKQSEFKESIRQFNEEIARLKAKDKQEYELEIKNLEMQKQKIEQDQKQWEAEMALKKQQLEEEKRQFNAQQAAKTSSSPSVIPSIKKSNTSSNSNAAISTAKKAVNALLNQGKEPTINHASVAALGYGPISEATLAKYVASGKVTQYIHNGQYYFKRNTNYVPNLKLR